MSRRPLFALALILSANLAFAVEPVAVVKAPSVAKVGKLIRLDAADSKGDVFLWESMTGEDFAVDSGGKVAWFVAASPGKYRFLLIAGGSTDGKTRLAKAVAEVIVDGASPLPDPPSPVPPPAPSPVPVPPPTPVALGPLFATYIADASNLLPAHAAMKSGPRTALRSLDTTWRWYQDDESEPRNLRLLDHAAARPSVVIQSKDGRVLNVMFDPSEADVVAKVKELRGVKP